MLPKIPKIATEHDSLREISQWMSSIAQRLNTLLPAGGAGMLSTSVPGMGTVLEAQFRGRPQSFYLGVIVNESEPDADDDYTDNRYWVKEAFLDQETVTQDTDAAEPVEDDADDNVAFTATNISEAGTHNLPVDGTKFVWYTKVRGRASDGETIEQVIFACEPVATPSHFHAKITAVSGSFPEFNYTVQRIVSYNGAASGAARWVTDGVNKSAKNGMEFGGTAPYTYGNGVTITNHTTGEVAGGPCVIIPLGVGATVLVEPVSDGEGGTVYLFGAENSAEVP